MDIIYFIYGLSFVVMGLAIVIRYDHDSRLELTDILWLLAAFGFSHGLREWMDLWRMVRGDGAGLAAARPVVLLVSYLFLFEFGRRLVLAAVRARPVARLLGRWTYAPLLAGLAAGTAVAGRAEVAMDVWSRLLLGFPGAVLAGLGFLAYGRRRVASVLAGADTAQVRAAFQVAGGAFVAYGVFGGLIGPRMEWFPASVLNQDAFLAALHVPVQVPRSACAVLVAVAVGFLLKVFHLEGVKRLHDSEERLRSMADHAQDAIIEIDSAGSIEFWNPAAERLFGHAAAEVVGRKLHEVIVPERFRGAFRANFPRFAETGEGVMLGRSVEMVGLRRDGSEVPVEVTIGALPGATGRHAIGILRDITERHEAEQRLKLGARVIAHALNGIVVTDEDTRIQLVNPAFTRITGYSGAEVLGKTPQVLKSGRHSAEFYAEMWRALKVEGEWQGEIWNRRRDGGIYPEWLSLSAIRDGRGHVTHYVGIFSDISQRKELEQDLERMAFYDPLTGLANRTLFHERLRQALRDVKRYGGFRVAVLYLDLDLFKQVNDRHGHHVGDDLLEEVGKRLIAVVREADTVARMGGDEFAIVLTHVADTEVAGAIAGKIVTALTEPFTLRGDVYCRIGTSIGIALAPDHGGDVDTLVTVADHAMYEAKRGGRNQYRLAVGA
jgi:diguanylate cyclase (GGDEF)-like protein/PAS domain S-box-containing protein